MTDNELDQAAKELERLRVEVREALAEDLGGEPDDYRSDRAVADGGDN